MFSATWPKEVRGLARDFQTDPVFLNVGSMELSANPNITQNVEVIDEFSKQGRLFQLLEHIMNQVGISGHCTNFPFPPARHSSLSLS
jgi:ATP-dependent RNA helicase DDX5/DBP2